ncbi:MAG: hypothetical protein NZ750_07560 [Anaerolineae bacterium]|nr:hypothetical protein [Anaerolineae bacterium]MDW8172205.1 hypothetical protein [Anaerolineae bacterium]
MSSQSSPTSEQLYRLMDMLDELHSAAEEGRAAEFIGLSAAELAATLREIIYTAQEALQEIQAHRVAQIPTLHLVDKKIDKVG